MKHLALILVVGMQLWPIASWAGITAVQGCTNAYGTLLGSNSGVAAYSDYNPPSPQPTKSACNGGTELKYECVQYARDWGAAVMGYCLPSVTYAYQLWGKTTTYDGETMTDYGNGSSTPPQFGDLLVYKSTLSGSGGAGHVAAIVAVSTSGGYIRVAEQNFTNCVWSGDYARQLPLSASGGYTISGSDIYGWIRVGSGTPAFHDAWVTNSGVIWGKPGNIIDNMFVTWKNDGSDYWLDARNVSNAHDVEMCIVDGATGERDLTQWLIPQPHNGVGWISSTGRIVGPSPSPTNPNNNGTFTFAGQIPSVSSQDHRVWLRLFHQGNKMDDWPGVNLLIRVDADPPAAFSAAVNPTTNNVNSFSFSWTASSDALSGLKGYYWSVNGGAETFTTALSVPAGAYATQQGTNALNVRAVDNVGNSRGAPPVSFTLNSSPCAGREIPHSPCVGPATCYPPASASLQTMPELTPMEWKAVGSAFMAREGNTYSVGFEYRAVRGSRVTLGVGGALPSARALVVGSSSLPKGEWRMFWSAPFNLVGKDAGPRYLRIDTDPAEGVEIRNVRVQSSPALVSAQGR